MVPLEKKHWYKCYANGTTGSTNGTIGKAMVPLATNGKITNGTIGKPQTEPLKLTIFRQNHAAVPDRENYQDLQGAV